VVGFTAGAAVLIATSQMSNIIGVTIPQKHSFIHIWGEVISRIADTNLYVFSIAIVTLLVALVFKIVLPRWPGMLIAMVGGSLAALSSTLKSTVSVCRRFAGASSSPSHLT
jgi:SulP family sulfate permease